MLEFFRQGRELREGCGNQGMPRERSLETEAQPAPKAESDTCPLSWGPLPDSPYLVFVPFPAFVGQGNFGVNFWGVWVGPRRPLCRRTYPASLGCGEIIGLMPSQTPSTLEGCPWGSEHTE